MLVAETAAAAHMDDMTGFDPSLHPRGQKGQWADKHNSAPESALVEPQSRARFNAVVLPEPDPAGGFDTVVEAPTGIVYLRGGVMHRDDGPAYEGMDGTVEYRRNGLLDREAGPAVVWDDGAEEYWEQGTAQLTA